MFDVEVLAINDKASIYPPPNCLVVFTQ